MTGRTAFMDLAPAGHRIRMMEPGEAEPLRRIAGETGLFGGEAPDTAAFVRWLLRHEVFVAEAPDGRPAGFAAARDAVDLYWLSGLGVRPDWTGRGLRKALLRAVLARAGWFFHRAVGTALQAEDERAAWFRRHGFLAVAPGDLTPDLEDLAAATAPGVSFGGGHPVVSAERIVMVHWL